MQDEIESSPDQIRLKWTLENSENMEKLDIPA